MPSDLFRNAGSLRADYDAVQWAGTALGPVSSWSPALRAAVHLTLATRFPITLLWGPELVLIYNEAYAAIVGGKHPAALGMPARGVFPEVWDTVGPMLEDVRSGGEATWTEDSLLPLVRDGFLEERYFTFSYSPVRGEHGAVEGVIDIVADTTRQVIDRRRLELLSRLGGRLTDLSDPGELADLVLPVLRAAAADLPAVDVRLASGPQGTRDPRLPLSPGTALGDCSVLVEDTPHGQVAWVRLDEVDEGPDQPVLVVLLSEQLAPDEAYLGFLRLIATTVTQALDRVHARQAERRVEQAELEMSTALQRSLLTSPRQPDDLTLAVRYQPAAAMAQVGGDWYDSFVLPDGSLTLVVGDVSGHDRQAAAAMAQVRNLLRGVSFTLGRSPAVVLSGLDAAMHGLEVDVFATAVLAQVEQGEDDALAGRRTLRWSNAGHPPPVLLPRAGGARLLETPPDLLLGLSPDTARCDHTCTLEPGASVVFYTDGLVERRGTALADALEHLTHVLTGHQDSSPEQLCDHLIAEFGASAEDDIALLVLHVS